jgi:hypothetical protein
MSEKTDVKTGTDDGGAGAATGEDAFRLANALRFERYGEFRFMCTHPPPFLCA